MTEEVLGTCLGSSVSRTKQRKYSGTGYFGSWLWLATKGWEPELDIHPGQDPAPYPLNSSMHVNLSVHTPLIFAEKSWIEVTVYTEKVTGLKDQKSGLQRYVEVAVLCKPWVFWTDVISPATPGSFSSAGFHYCLCRSFHPDTLTLNTYLRCWREENRNEWLHLNSDTSKSEELTWATDRMQPASYKKKNKTRWEVLNKKILLRIITLYLRK